MQRTDPMAAEQPDYTNAVFGNGLLFDHIAEYLGIPDLKILRQTCKLFYSRANGKRKFISSLRLTVSDETIRENGVCDSITWENVSIVVSRTSNQHFRNIRTDSVQDLQLLHPTSTSEELTQLTNHRDSCLALYELLEVRQFPNLRSMTLDLNLMCYNIPMATMASIVGTVKEFRFYGVGLQEFSPWLEEGRSAANNLEMIGGLPWKLHSFVIEGLRLSQRISQAVGAIPASSASALQELKLCSVKFGRETHIHGVRFLQLKSIGLEIDGCEEYNGIEINCQQLYRSARFASSVLAAIRRICSSRLHTLRLRGDIWLKSFPDFESWAFIRDLTALKNFMICGTYINSADNVVAEILNCLPLEIQSLELHYIRSDIVAESETIAALTGFPNLVQLKLSAPEGIKCGTPITDAILQTICRSLIKLRVLQLKSTQITDFGLTGERGNYNSRMSVRNLKGLQDMDLDIFGCLGITEKGILKAIQFQELRDLRLCTQISKSAIVEIASHNPSLEYAACDLGIGRCHVKMWVDEYFRGLFSSIMAVNPRLTRIHMLYRPVEGDVLLDEDDVIYRPSYGVSANLAYAVARSHVRNTLKIVKSSKVEPSDYGYTYTYYYNLPN